MLLALNEGRRKESREGIEVDVGVGSAAPASKGES